MVSAILKKLWATHRRNQANRRQARSRRQDPGWADTHPNLLSVPAEIRLNIYSYLISPSSVSRPLRATCRQIKKEFDHEDREAFLRRMMVIQRINWKDAVYIHLLCTTAHHHVNAVVELPQLIPGAEHHSVAVMYDEMHALLQSLPLNTRSITIVIKPYAQCRGRDYDIFYCMFTFKLYEYFGALTEAAATGATDLRTLQVLAADPIMLTLEVPLAGGWRRLSSFEIKGLWFELKAKRKGLQMRIRCPTHEKYSRFTREWMWYLRAGGQFRPRYQRGCVG